MPIISPRSGKDERAALLPAALLPLFNSQFIDSFDLCETYVARTALATLRSSGLEEACREAATVAQAIDRAGLRADVARVPATWLLETLAACGWVTKRAGAEGNWLYQAACPPVLPDPAEIRAAQEALDARCLPSYDIVALAAMQYPAVLRGQLTGDQALFGPEGLVAWVKYFSNDNPLYGISNAVGALASEQALAGKPAAILEIGGGLGSGAAALLDHLAPVAGGVTAYHFTEISPLFMKRAQRTLAARRGLCPFIFSALDIDQPFAGQGIARGAHDLVYGVNVLHVARDLAFTLGEIRNALTPAGLLVISECVRPTAGKPLHIEFVFNLLDSFRDPVLVSDWRPNGGFLTPEQWHAALQANGFGAIRVFPDIAGLRGAYPDFSVAAIIARRT